MTPEQTLQLAKDFHHQAEEAREKKEYLDALGLYSQALFYYIEAESVIGVSEVYAAISIAYRHLAKQSPNSLKKKLSEKQVELSVRASVEMAEFAKDEVGDASALALAYLNAGKYYELRGSLPRAVTYFEQAVEWMEKTPPASHDRPAVLWDFKLKLAMAKLVQAQSMDLEHVLTAIHALETDRGVDAAYNIKVWVSGAYLFLAKYLKDKDRKHADHYLEKARQIIAANNKLVIRKEEYEELAEEFRK